MRYDLVDAAASLSTALEGATLREVRCHPHRSAQPFRSTYARGPRASLMKRGACRSRSTDSLGHRSRGRPVPTKARNTWESELRSLPYCFWLPPDKHYRFVNAGARKLIRWTNAMHVSDPPCCVLSEQKPATRHGALPMAFRNFSSSSPDQGFAPPFWRWVFLTLRTASRPR